MSNEQIFDEFKYFKWPRCPLPIVYHCVIPALFYIDTHYYLVTKY